MSEKLFRPGIEPALNNEINGKEKGNSMARRDTNVKQQTFSLTAPVAMSVMLADDFTQWQEKSIPTQKQAAEYGRQVPNSHPETITIASLGTANNAM